VKNNTQQELPKAVMPVLSSTVLKWAKRIFTPLALGFIIYFGWQSREILAMVIANAQPKFLILAVLMWVMAHFVAPICTLMALKTCGSSVFYRFAFKSYVDRLPARYLPGGIWHTVGRVVDFHNHGIKHPYLTGLFLLENILALGIGFALGGGCVWYFRGIYDIWGQIAAFAAVSSVIGLVLTPTILNWQVLKHTSKVSYRFYIQSLGIYIVAWFVLALAFICYLSAFPLAFGNVSLLEVGATYLFSWSIGFITVFAPQGIGVFEIVAGHILTAPLSLGSIATLIAGFRVVSFIADVILWGLLRCFLLLRKRFFV
jgi:hypothetical protein